MKDQATPAPLETLSASSETLWNQIHAMWAMDDAGRAVLMVALLALDRKAKAWEIVSAEGLLKGGRAHPLLGTIKDSDGLALKAFRQLGLEPPKTIGRPPGQGPA